MRMRPVLAAVAALATIAALSGCAAGGSTTSDANSINGKPTGNIKVLTQRTDIVDTVFKDYKKEFEKAYPGVTVTFQAITDYEGDVATMLNAKSYGDVLLIPNSVGRDQLADYFEPLGTVKDLSKTYRFIQEQSFDGKGYGIAITGNAQGILYNKKVWAAAGLTSLPKTPGQFVDDLKKIKANTDATPLYTNYKDGWPLSQWEGNRGILGDPNISNELTTDTSPWSADKYHGIVDGLLYDVVHDGLTENDPTTTDWESSKGLLGSGKVGTMVLGSWAITQFQDAAVKAGASKDDIGYMPFPYQVKGQYYSTIGGDYKNAISKYSQHKAAAYAWIKWFAAKSGYAHDQGGLSPLVNGPAPDTLKDLDAAGVKYIELTPPAAKSAAWETNETKESEIDLWGNVYRQKLVDIARGAASGDKSSDFADLNKAWSAAVSTVTG